MQTQSKRLLFALAGVAAALVIGAQDAVATSQRTFVASSGTDTHPCTLTQPCRSFGAALVQTSAHGEIIVLDSAGYGPVTIGKSVSIVAPSGVYAGVTVFTGDGITVNAGTSDTVVLRGLTVNGQGGIEGIAITHAGTVQVEDCVIEGMHDAIDFEPANAVTLIVTGTTIRNNSSSAITAVASSGGALSALEVWLSTVTHNGIGIQIQDIVQASIGDTLVADSGIGVAMQNTTLSAADTHLVVDRAQIVRNASYGLVVSGTGTVTSFVNVSHSAIANNGIGVYASPGRIRLASTQITGNTTGIDAPSGGIDSLGNNMRFGNVTEGDAATPITPY